MQEDYRHAGNSAYLNFTRLENEAGSWPVKQLYDKSSCLHGKGANGANRGWFRITIHYTYVRFVSCDSVDGIGPRKKLNRSISDLRTFRQSVHDESTGQMETGHTLFAHATH